MDEGVLAYGAERVLEGQIPHRDFVSAQPPLSFYSAALFFKTFGTSLASLRILGISIYVAIALLIYGIMRTVAGPLLSLVAAFPALILGIPFFNFVPFAIWQGITATLVAVFLLARGVLSKSSLLIFATGIMTAISILLRHDQGFYLLLSTCSFAVALKFAQPSVVSSKELRRLIACWAAGILAVILPLVIFWWFEQALGKMFSQLVVFPLTTYAKTSSRAFPHWNSASPFSDNAVTLLFYLSPVLQGAVLIWLVSRFVRKQYCWPEAIATFLLIWSALFYCQTLTRSDWHHLLITLPPIFILIPYAGSLILQKFDALVARSLQNRRALQIAKGLPRLFAVLVLIWFLSAVSPACLPDLSTKTFVSLPRGQVRIEGGDKMTNFVHLVQQAAGPERSILSLPYYPILYFLSERRNPTQWNYLWPGDQTPQDHQTLIDQAKRDPPALVVLVKEKQMQEYAPLVIDYVHSNYRLAGDSGELAVYLSGDSH